MTRRDLLQLASLLAASFGLSPAAAAALLQAPPATAEPNPSVKRVFVIFKCHLDVGFTDTQAKVMQTYFKQYYPTAMATAAQQRERKGDRYVWTTGSWLLYEYLEQASAAERTAMEKAVADGDVAWHALPFSWQTELFDRSMVDGCFSLSRTLDARFGKTTIAGKMTDVPGHTRGLASALASNGVRLLDIGVNPASTPPDVPAAFLWSHAGQSVAVLYHRSDYGGLIEIPGTDIAVDVEVRPDNSGPHTQAEIEAIYTKLRQRFPNAQVNAASLSQVAEAVVPIQSVLPVVTGEIGDTWIYGAPSDPTKMARFREMSRLRQEWIASHTLEAGSAVDRNLLRRLALAGEHTWGTDTKRYIDHINYSPRQLAENLNKPGYLTMERSWQEKRDDITDGINSLPTPLKTQAEQRLQTLVATAPDQHGLKSAKPNAVHRTKHFEVALDPATGAITHLKQHSSGQSWADPTHPLALFTYQTLSAADYSAFLKAYVLSHEWWAPQDFGKPNIEKLDAQSHTWTAALRTVSAGHVAQGFRLLAELAIDDPTAQQHGLVAWPARTFLQLDFPDAEPIVTVRLTVLQKAPNRMPEALWLTFNPTSPEGQPAPWMLEKLDQLVRADDVLSGGGRRMHGVTQRLGRGTGDHALEITTLDAPVAAFDERSPLNFSRELPDPASPAHICLFNNAWGTNYPQWDGGDWLFRFTLRGREMQEASA